MNEAHDYSTTPEPFMMPNERRPNPVGKAGLAYEQTLRAHAHSNNGYGTSGYFDPSANAFNQFKTI